MIASQQMDGSNPSKPGTAREMSMMEHLEELRHRILVSAIALIIGVMLSFWFSLPVMEWLKALVPQGVHFIQLTPGEVVMASFRIALLLGVILASPVVVYQLLRFIFPALSGLEKRILLGIFLFGSCLFSAGVAFAYFVMLPPTLGWLLAYGHEIAETQMSIARFIEFTTTLILVIGLLFEMPIVLMLLSFTRVISSQKLMGQWRVAIVSMFLFAAIITPADPLSMVLVGNAMLSLYGFSILMIRLCGR